MKRGGPLTVFLLVSVISGVLAGNHPAFALLLEWKSLAPFEDPRTGLGVEGAAASLIGDKIYVSHGNRKGIEDTKFLSVYDITANTWTHGGSTAPDASIARAELAGGTAFGKHYAIGGRPPALNVIEEFDPLTHVWTTKTPMTFARAGVAAASWDNKIYVMGGRSGNNIGLGSILKCNEVYDPSTDRWTTLAPMPIGVSDHYATIAVDGKIYVFGGITSNTVPFVTVTDAVQIYDIASNTWSFGTPMLPIDPTDPTSPTGRADAIAGVIEGQIAVIGGFHPFIGNLNVTQLYDPLTDSWSYGPPVPEPVSEMAQGVTYDRRGIFVIGSGLNKQGEGKTVFVLQVIPEPATVRLLLVGAAVMLLLCLRYSALSRRKKISL